MIVRCFHFQNIKACENFSIKVDGYSVCVFSKIGFLCIHQVA